VKRDLQDQEQEAALYKGQYKQLLQHLDDLSLLFLQRENATLKKFNELQNEHTDVLKVDCKLMEESNEETREKISPLKNVT
jgi:hypothetical protein